MAEFIRSEKLQKSANNQLYLYNRKPRARVKLRDPGTRDPLGGYQEQDICVFGDFVHVATNNGDSGMNHFEKNVYFPNNYFVNGVMPITFYSLQYRGDVVHKVLPVLTNLSPNRARVRVESQQADFAENQDYFINIIAFAPHTLAGDANEFMPVNWGSDDEDLQISSDALTQMGANSDYLTHNKVAANLSNVDYSTDDRNYFVRYLNDNIIIYGKYDEFSPTVGEGFNKNDASDSDHPQKIIRSFEFPDNLFDTDIHPVVVANVGAKIATDGGSTDAIRKLSCIIKEIKRKSFTLEIWELSNSQEFASGDTYFVSYIVMGERPGAIERDKTV